MTYHKQTHLKMEHWNETVVKWSSCFRDVLHSQYKLSMKRKLIVIEERSEIDFIFLWSILPYALV